MENNKTYEIYDKAKEVNGEYTNKKSKFSCRYIRKVDMDEIYPAGGFSVVGQIGMGVSAIGLLSNNGKNESVYKVEKVKFGKIIGYVQTGEDDFLAVVRSVLPMIILWSIVILLLLLAVGLGVFFTVKNKTANNVVETTTAPLLVLDPNLQEGDEWEATLPEKAEVEGHNISVTGFGSLKMVAGETHQRYCFPNDKENPGFMKVRIELADTQETIFESQLIPPGYRIDDYDIKRPLSAGKYNVVLYYDFYTYDKEKRPLNNYKENKEMIVENPVSE